jgi:hypothetical protein
MSRSEEHKLVSGALQRGGVARRVRGPDVRTWRAQC